MKTPSLVNISGRLAVQRDRRLRRLLLGIERLDQRLVCSGMTIPVMSSSPPSLPVLQVELVTPVATTPASSVSDAAARPLFSLRFSQPINSFFLDNNDFRVEQISPDGSVVTPDVASSQYSETLDPHDPTSKTLLVAFTTPFDQGTYRLVLDGTNSLVGADGSVPSLNDQPLNFFSVGAASADLTQTMDLGTVAAPATTEFIPVVSNQEAAPLTRMTLGGGRVWTLASAFEELDPSLFQVNLYNSERQLIISRPGSDLASINDNLTTGTFYLQIFRNDPVSDASVGLLSVTLSSAPEQAAVPVVKTLKAINFNDSSANPDSILIQFAGSTLNADFKQKSPSVYSLVDATGCVWSLTPTAYDPATNTLALVFPGYLPTGHYTIQANLDHTLNLTGDGVATLGTFDTVFQELGANNLGTVFPTSGTASRSPLQLAAGESATLYLSIVQAEQYQVSSTNGAISTRLFRVAANESQPTTNPAIDLAANSRFYLEPGLYRMVVTNPTATSQQVGFTFTRTMTSSESLSLGGVGQMPASTGNSFLIGIQTATASLANPPSVATVAPVAPRDVQTSPSSAAPTGSSSGVPLESTGSFSLTGTSQAPLGSFSSPIAGGSESSSQLGVLAVAMNNTLMIVPSSGRSAPSRAGSLARPINVERFSAPQPVIEASTNLPLTMAPIDDQVPSNSALVPTRKDDVLDPSSVQAASELVPEIVALLVPNLGQDTAAPEDTWSTWSDSESTTMTSELAGGMTSLVVVAGACVAYRRIKVAQSHANPFRSSRPWSLWGRSKGSIA